jgi:hypothetical protein
MDHPTEVTPSCPAYDRQPREALGEMPTEVRLAWAARYVVQDGAGPRAEALVERAEAALIAAGRLATIRDVWMLLAQRAASADDAELRAAAALAGMAMGLRAV